MKISQVISHFKRFIEKDGMGEINYEFNRLNHGAPLYYGGEIYSCQWNKDKNLWHVEYSKNDEHYIVDESLETYSNTYFNDYFNLIKDELTKHYLNLNTTEFENLIVKLDLELRDLIKISNSKNPFLNHLTEALERFRREILDKYQKEEPLKEVSSVPYVHKIKWLGFMNTLSTFLLDYSSTSNNLGKALMERDITAFKSLMINCFLDSKGDALSEDTVNTYFDTNKQNEKRAKKEIIELEKLAVDPDEQAPKVKPRRKSNLYQEVVAVPSYIGKTID